MTWPLRAAAWMASAAVIAPGAGYGARIPAPYPPPVSAAALARLPQATTYTRLRRAPSDPSPYATTSGLVVHAVSRRLVYSSPGGAPLATLPATELGGPTWLPVISREPGWVRVLLPSRPDHATGWLCTDGGLVFRHSPYVIKVRTAARRMSVIDGGRLLGTWTVAVGAPATPTPAGRTFVLASLIPTGSSTAYGPLILPLGTHSNTLDTFGGGPGTVAIHGWPDPRVFGHAVSHGCVRVPWAAFRVLARVPLGSLVLITRGPPLAVSINRPVTTWPMRAGRSGTAINGRADREPQHPGTGSAFGVRG